MSRAATVGRGRRRRAFGARQLLATLLALGVYAQATDRLGEYPRAQVQDGLRVHMPLLMQLWQAGGDRHLAANMDMVRSMTVGVEVTDAETLRVQAALADDASRLNPRHEDNYYISAALLSFQGHIDTAQTVLRRAADARPWDVLPPFLYAFNASYFERDYARAAAWAERAAQRSREPNASALRGMAAKWRERGGEPAQAIEMIERLKRITSDQNVLRLMDARIQRLRGLIALREAARAWKDGPGGGKGPGHLDDLVRAGLLDRLPHDPLGMGYELDAAGVPQLASGKKSQEGGK